MAYTFQATSVVSFNNQKEPTVMSIEEFSSDEVNGIA
jgi:hypothetical protein